MWKYLHQTQIFIQKIPEINLTFMYHRQDWPNIKKMYILLALKFSVTYPKILRKCLVIQINLKENLRNSFYWVHFTLLKNSLAGLLWEISMLCIFNNSFASICIYCLESSTPRIVTWTYAYYANRNILS